MKKTLSLIEGLKNKSGFSLAKAFVAVEEGFSEKVLANQWLRYMLENTDLYSEGWYDPPPHGVICVFGKAKDGFKRICEESFRPEYMWPKPDIFFDSEDIIATYISPVHKATNLIGDFGLNIYLGTDNEIKEHMTEVLDATLTIGRYAKTGMRFQEIYAFAMELAKIRGFYNNIASSADQTGTNIGHTIPLSYINDVTSNSIATANSYGDIKEALRTGRKFINGAETQIIEDNMAFTIEPRFSNDKMPNTWFHMTVIFENGQPRICHGMRPICEVTGMTGILKLLP